MQLSQAAFQNVVIQRDEYLKTPRIALSRATPDQLQVDPTALVNLCQNHMQSACIGDSIAEVDVRTATGHVRRNCHRPALPCTGDDLGFSSQIPCIQNLMRNLCFAQQL